MKPGGMKDGRFPLQAELQNVAINNLFTMMNFIIELPGQTNHLRPKTGEASEWKMMSRRCRHDEAVLRQQPWLKVRKVEILLLSLSSSYPIRLSIMARIY